jgi:hypothetical protein
VVPDGHGILPRPIDKAVPGGDDASSARRTPSISRLERARDCLRAARASDADLGKAAALTRCDQIDI